jgi:uncharacterized protein YjiS (DUF1127 family)
MNHRTIASFRPDANRTGTLAWLNQLGSRGARAFRKWRQMQRSRRALSTFDDRLLADLGIARHQIDPVERTDYLLRR